MIKTCLISILCLTCLAADWYVSSTGSGVGTLASPGTLTNAVFHSGWASAIAPGDTVWLRGGSGNGYLGGPMLLDTNTHSYTYFWTVGFAGASNNLVTWRSYTNEWAVIGGNWSFGNKGYHRFRDLEFYDPYKGQNPTNLPASPNGPWTIFGVSSAVGMELINCVVHDCGIATGGMNDVRGCVFYYAGMNGLEHLVYAGVNRFMNNIALWSSKDTINFGPLLISSNIFAGTGAALINRSDGGNNMRLSLSTQFTPTNTIANNYCYNTSAGYNSGTDFNIGASGDGSGLANIIYGNVFDNYIPCIFDNGLVASTVFTNNTVHVDTTDFSYNFLRRTNYGTWTVDYNRYTVKSPSTVHFYDRGSVYTFAQWTNATALDVHSTSTNGATPADAVYVMGNQDQAKRAHIAVYNWSHADNVTVDVSSVLANGDIYTVRSAQDYNGPVLTGTNLAGTITLPMTNLTVSPFICAGDRMTNPPAMNPEFGAFVLQGNVTASSIPPAITVQPQSQPVIRGQTAVFTVTATGDAPLTYQWRFNGVDIVGEVGTTLTLTNVQGVNAGNYTVFIANGSGSVLSNTAVLSLAATARIGKATIGKGSF